MRKLDIYIIVIFILFRLSYRIGEVFFGISDTISNINKYFSDIFVMYLIYKLYILITNDKKKDED